MKKLLFMILLFSCVSACTRDPEEPRPEASTDPSKLVGTSPEDKQLEAEQKELIAQAQQNPEESPSAGPSSYSICGRTEQVKKAILAKLSRDCDKVTRQELEAILTLNFSFSGITDLKGDDFEGLTSLKRLYLHNNDLTSLHEGLFQGLTSLEWLYLHDNELTFLTGGLVSGAVFFEAAVSVWQSVFF